jgi:hypothetical protein
MFKTPEDRLTEIELYELVAEEIENNQQSKGLWTKALSESAGDMERAEALYIKLRVQMISDEWTLITEKKTKKRAEKQAEEREIKKSKQRKGNFYLILIMLIAVFFVAYFLPPS